MATIPIEKSNLEKSTFGPADDASDLKETALQADWSPDEEKRAKRKQVYTTYIVIFGCS